MKNWLYYLGAVALFWTMSLPVKAAMPDLNGAELQQTGMCVYEGQMFDCAVYQKDGHNYVLYAADEKLLLIFQVKDGATMPYTNANMTLLWRRGQKDA